MRLLNFALLALALLTTSLIYFSRDITFQRSLKEISRANPKEIKTLDILTLAKNAAIFA